MVSISNAALEKTMMTYSLEAAADLLFRTTGITELPVNCDGLAACLNAAVAEAAGRAAALERVATGEVRHLHNGLCPDVVEGFDSRDPDCPACQILLGDIEPGLKSGTDVRACASGTEGAR